jgi:hypothetical protein
MRKIGLAAAILAVGIGLIVSLGRPRVMVTTGARQQSRTAPDVQYEEAAAAEAVRKAATAARIAAERAAAQEVLAHATGASAAVRAASKTLAEPAATTPSGLPTVMSSHWADGKFTNFSPDQLADMASRCELRWQLPSTPDDKYVASMRALYAELTGDPNSAAQASLRSMTDALRIDADDDAAEVHRRLSAQRAGDPVTLSGSIYERYLQLQLSESESAQSDGVPLGPKFTLTGCDPGTAMFRSTR